MLAQPNVAQSDLPKGILILGAAKSGTTALFYAIREALASGHGMSVSGLFEPRDETRISDYLSSTTDQVRLVKGLLGVLLRRGGLIEKLNAEFDRKIVIYRDPRDNVVSRICFMLARRVGRDKEKIAQVLELFRQKERVPNSISIVSMVRQMEAIIGQAGLLDSLRSNSLLPARMKKERGDAYFFMPYADLVSGQFGGLSKYLGFAVNADFEVDQRHSYVVRSKSSGAWKDWFLDEDVEFFARAASADLALLGFDPGEMPNAVRTIDPKTCSEYVAGMFKHAEEKRWRPKTRYGERERPIAGGDQSKVVDATEDMRQRRRAARLQRRRAGRSDGLQEGAGAAKRLSGL